jgi:class 3 adenylate cyclase/tetratricopeptide (TPR) repeat protein
MCGHNLSLPAGQGDAIQEPAEQTPVPVAAPQPAGAQLQQYIPPELLDKLAAAQQAGGMVGERRVVTMLFCDVKDSTTAAEQLDPEEWSEIINGAFEHMIAPVYRYEGTVARLMGDGILAFFGAPIAHEDDAVRALLAGLDIVSGSEGYKRQVRGRYGMDVDVRVGINTGRVVVGAVGSDLRLEYTALGDAINVAARMEQTAEPGTVQIAEETFMLVAPLFEFEALGPVMVKGKREPIKAYRVLGRKAEPGRMRGIAGLESPLVGRQEELVALRNALGDVRGGGGRIVFLVGQAGLGKTRLISELYAQWQGDDRSTGPLRFWMHRPVASYQASEAYRVLKDQIRLMYGIADPAAPEEIAARLEENIAVLPEADRAGIYEPLARVLGMLEEDEASLAEGGETFKRRLFAAALTSIRELARRKPSVLVLDDLHWADPASVEVIQHLLQLVQTTPILFLCAIRPDRNAAGWGLLERAKEEYVEHYQETVLRPLAEEESQAMLDGLLQGMQWPPRLRALILDKAEGNPFFIEEVVRALIDGGVVKQNGAGGWHAAGGVDDFVVPGTLQALLAARIDRLVDEDRQVLQSAAVIGRSFSYPVLRRINEETAALDRSLERLALAELIEEEAGEAGKVFRFRNTLAQETVYRSILRRTRRDYHRVIGEALLELAGDQADEQLPVLAHHFYQAHDARGFSLNQQAGDEAYALYANREAAAYYGRAIELTRNGVAVASEVLQGLYQRRGRALELASLHAEALTVYQEMVGRAREGEDPAMELTALVSTGTIYSTANDQFNAVEAEMAAEQALALARKLGDEPSEAKIYWNLLNMYRLSERPPQALESGERSLELARKNDLREQLAYTANDMTHVYTSVGQPDKAWQTVDEAIAMWRELGNRPMLADSLATASLLSTYNADYEKTVALSDESYRISLEIENFWGQSYSRIAIGQLYWQRGEPDRAIEAMSECVRLGELAGFKVAPLFVGSSLGLVYANLGAFEKALPLVRRAVAESRVTMPYYESVALSILGQVLLLAGEMAQATVVFDELKAIKTSMEPLLELTVEEGKCRMLLAQRKPEQAVKSARRLIEILRAGHGRLIVPTAMFLHGQALLASGQLEPAGDVLAQARVEAEQLALDWPMWQILVTTAEVEEALGDVERAEEYRRQAREIFKGIAERLPAGELREPFLSRSF